MGRAEVRGGTSRTWTRQVQRPWGRKGLGKQASGIGGERARDGVPDGVGERSKATSSRACEPLLKIPQPCAQQEAAISGRRLCFVETLS